MEIAGPCNVYVLQWRNANDRSLDLLLTIIVLSPRLTNVTVALLKSSLRSNRERDVTEYDDYNQINRTYSINLND